MCATELQPIARALRHCTSLERGVSSSEETRASWWNHERIAACLVLWLHGDAGSIDDCMPGCAKRAVRAGSGWLERASEEPLYGSCHLYA